MKDSIFSKRRLAALVVATALLGTAFLASQVAAGTASQKRAGTAVVKIKLQGKRLFFDAPKTVASGQKLEILNTTSGKQVGPHSFSLVEPGVRPKTAPGRKQCFTPGHICLSIAKWHGLKGPKSPITINPAKAGKAGWDTEGSLTKAGDSWFSGGKKGNSFTQVVSAKAGTTIHFMCAVHPWMQGEIKVTP